MKQLLTGLTVPQEHVCLPLENLVQSLSVYLTTKSNSLTYEVTSRHAFLGYKPLVLLITLDAASIENVEAVCLNFVSGAFTPTTEWQGYPSAENCVARLIVKRIQQSSALGKGFLFEGVYGAHKFLNSFYQYINNFREALRRRKAENVGLPGNLYDQVRIAYSIPRIISLITLGNTEQMNMFPTDLHGSVDAGHYASSLRIGGKANDQVERQGRVTICFMPVESYQVVYSLGKNHMLEMAAAKKFPIGEMNSQLFNIPLPAGALRYIELKRISSTDVGIHRIHLYEKMNEENLVGGKTLAHVHQYYVQWRLDHNLRTTMLLRSR